jgi:hypothetical protein
VKENFLSRNPVEASPILKIMDLALRQDPRPLARLAKGKPVAEGRKAVAALSENDLGAKPQALPLIQAALYLCFDCFEESHNIANEHEGTVAGNWIHAILHRREPDASNSKYWYARVKWPAKVTEAVGRDALALLRKLAIPELEPLAKKMERAKAWVPEAFVDLCDEFRQKEPQTPAYRALAGIQEIEWRALAEYILST